MFYFLEKQFQRTSLPLVLPSLIVLVLAALGLRANPLCQVYHQKGSDTPKIYYQLSKALRRLNEEPKQKIISGISSNMLGSKRLV